ncbi:hypothetical protein SLEP1_g38653 [Rubroshorea leprosula]|uniref:Aluminum-activated malate transporter n=1 Tax=Rubroshorea leprosula TaxID=152421 RepID=A0AAV5KYE0_9ROSI|nr:hypothetical protein SLEP1_g38653 [Rubroshorea leprosula]
MESSIAQENPAMKTIISKSKEKVLSILESYIKLGKDDPRRVKHSIKVALAITLVSFIYYDHNLYHTFKSNGIWAVITVVVVFEYTAGGTISKGLNRGLASFLAGALAFGAAKLANLIGNICGTEKAEATVIGISVFMIGGAACIIISTFIYPVWAGEDLHNSAASNLEKLANYLEGKFRQMGIGHGKFRFFHPWELYLKIGALVRECAALIEAINCHIDSDIQMLLHSLQRKGKGLNKKN